MQTSIGTIDLNVDSYLTAAHKHLQDGVWPSLTAVCVVTAPKWTMSNTVAVIYTVFYSFLSLHIIAVQ